MVRILGLVADGIRWAFVIGATAWLLLAVHEDEDG